MKNIQQRTYRLMWSLVSETAASGLTPFRHQFPRAYGFPIGTLLFPHHLWVLSQHKAPYSSPGNASGEKELGVWADCAAFPWREVGVWSIFLVFPPLKSTQERFIPGPRRARSVRLEEWDNWFPKGCSSHPSPLYSNKGRKIRSFFAGVWVIQHLAVFCICQETLWFLLFSGGVCGAEFLALLWNPGCSEDGKKARGTFAGQVDHVSQAVDSVLVIALAFLLCVSWV